MNNLPLIAITCIVFWSLSLQAQTPFENLKLIKTIDLKSQNITTDKLGNLYAVANEEIFKFDLKNNQAYS